MKRRDFLKNAAVGGLAFGLAPKLAVRASQAKGGPPPVLAVAEGESPARITREAVSALGGMKRFVSRGDIVLLKPNIGWDRTPEMAACTNPDVVKSLVEMCLEAGAKDVVVMDNPTNQAKRTYVRSGIQEAAREAGAKVIFPNPYRLKKMDLKGDWLKDWEVYEDIIEADKLINVPIAKHHSLSRVTLGMKNWLGAIGGPRNQLHQKLDQAMVDLARFFKPTLTVLDAYRILVRNGPQGGRPSDTRLTKTVVAGTDAVAVDAAGAAFFDIPPQDLLFLKLAAQKGLGEINLEKLKVEKRKV